MRTEAEIVAMRDRLERMSLYPDRAGGFDGDALVVLRWVCDPSVSDREVLDRCQCQTDVDELGS